MYQLPILILSLCLVFAAGCTSTQSVKDSWKYTKRQYYDYINTPAELDLDDQGSCEPYELALGEKVLEIDMKLKELNRTMENADTNPDQQWVNSLLSRFTWLSGVAILDPEGQVQAKIPDYSMKDFNAGPLLEEDKKQKRLDLRAYAHMTELGPEVYLAKPVYIGVDLKGYVVAHFDPQQLVQSSSGAATGFMMLSPYGLLWSDNSVANAEVLSANWKEILEDKSCGTIGSGSNKFYWLTRYIGNMPVVYAIPVSSNPVTGAAANPQQNEAPSTEAPVQSEEPAKSGESLPLSE